MHESVFQDKKDCPQANSKEDYFPFRDSFKRVTLGVVAQLVRAPPCHGGGCGFEPRQLRRGFVSSSLINKGSRAFGEKNVDVQEQKGKSTKKQSIHQVYQVDPPLLSIQGEVPLEKLPYLGFLPVMTTEESNLLEELFDRLARSTPSSLDPSAEQLIRSKIAANPTAPYQLVQSTLVLQHAVTAAQNRIATLEKQLTESVQPKQEGGFLSGMTNLFSPTQASVPRPAAQIPPPIPTAAPQYASTPQTGGFLKTALSTAAGVAGGAMLFQGIESLLGHNTGPFGGYPVSSGGIFGQETEPQITEVTNNYYNENASTGLSSFNGDDDSFNSQNYDFADNNQQDFGQGDEGSFFDADGSF